MENQGKQPEPLGGLVGDFGTVINFGLGVSEQGPKGQNLQCHSGDNLGGGVGALQPVVLEEIKRFSLTAGGLDGKRDRRLGPLNDLVDKATQEDHDCQIRYCNTKKVLHPRYLGTEPGNQDQRYDCQE